ncbi:ATG3/ATG10 family protein [Aspergillus homomorphus CBS 101889]|uniref:Ubiquitin-like-conjugating enzyme ATG10 n=1 Tax=Aspergillus homomorphus (strain CBS 101889) TaxID=1450537 RepID=A0A395HR07_ASPHC|nr:autophagy-related protein Atg10 [Aspergillus homomorphus CBS 101889]RAL08684.1 autophagy-related protein Atg10 [Aspergillus homomorphus CBS 101889]
MASSTCAQQPALANFPLLTNKEFNSACREFLDRVRLVDESTSKQLTVRLTQRTTGPILSIIRRIAHPGIPTCDGLSLEDEPNPRRQLEAYEDDPEALIRTTEPSIGLHVVYDVVLSPTYQTPVLYFGLRRYGHPEPLGIDAIYQYLVPSQYRKELRSVGVMGGISLGYHPDSGTPAFFVHPCNTADAMRQLAGHRHVTPETYLIIWLGLVGNRLGLQLPREIFATDGMRGILRC